MDYLQYLSFFSTSRFNVSVLNLIINGLPSILNDTILSDYSKGVLNLIINGLPSILRNEKN